jgi:hypothetical protein
VTSASWWRRLGDARAAVVAFVLVELAAIPLLLSWGNKWWFWADDWDFLAGRTGGNLGDLFRPHYQHWTTLPILAYRLLWTLFGIRHYVPYQLLVIGLHLVAALLLRTVMQRAGVRPWLASLVAGAFVFFGSGAENILIAFQITFVGSIVFGLAQLLLADHDGGLDRRDWFGLLAGLAGLMCSGVGVTMTVIVGMAMLMRRGWRIALVHTAPLALLYGIWSVVSPTGYETVNYHSQSPVQVIKFVAIGAGAGFGRLAQLPGLGIVLAVVLVIGVVIAIARQGVGELRGRFAVPLALLVGAGLFLVVTGIARSGQPVLGVHSPGTGPERARQSRYVYLVAAMALPAIAIAADAIARRWRLLTIPIVVLLLAGVPGNVHQLRIYTEQGFFFRNQTRIDILAAPRVPIAKKISPAIAPARFAALNMGWLLASLPSGRIPAPDPPLSPTKIASETLKLVLREAKKPTDENCAPLVATQRRVLRAFQRITLTKGSALITFYPLFGGDPSKPVQFPRVVGGRTVVASTGPLQLEIEPVARPAVLCGPDFKTFTHP